MTTTTKGLTPKQQQVASLINEGLSVPQVAKRLRIKPSSVYGHLHRIRDAGVEPNANGNGSAAREPEPMPQLNGAPVDIDVPTVIRSQLEIAEKIVAELDGEIEQMSQRLGEIKTKRQSAQEEIERHTSALKAYQV